MTAPTGYRGLPVTQGGWRDIGEAIQRLLEGKQNVTVQVTLTAGATSTVVSDNRLHGFSGIYLMPLTANAAAEIGNGTIWVSSQGKFTATITHANNGQTDRTFRLLLIG